MRVQVWYVCSKPQGEWAYTTGYITEQLMREKLFAADPASTLGLLCGPLGLLDNVCTPGLLAMGYPKDTIVSF